MKKSLYCGKRQKADIECDELMKRSFTGTLSLLLASGGILLFTSGCVTYQDQRTRQAVQEREDVLLVQEDLRRLSGRIEGLELELERLRRAVEQQRSDLARTADAQAQGAETRLAALERRIQEVDRARENDKKEIVERLSQTIEQLMRSQQAGRQATQARTTHSGYGYEHVVGPGETLSHIAQAYGVTTRVIIEANNLKNPDRLQVGQQLFIPE